MPAIYETDSLDEAMGIVQDESKVKRAAAAAARDSEGHLSFAAVSFHPAQIRHRRVSRAMDVRVPRGEDRLEAGENSRLARSTDGFRAEEFHLRVSRSAV